MKKTTLAFIIVILVALAIGAVWCFSTRNTNDTPSAGSVASTSTTASTTSTAINTTTEKPVVLSFPDNHLDTSDWQTYRNEEFGFEVKYPRDWKVGYNKNENNPTNDCGIADVFFNPKIHVPNDDRSVEICINNKTLQEVEAGSAKIGLFVVKRVTVNGISGVEFATRSETGEWAQSSFNLYVLEENGKTYRFMNSGGSEEYIGTYQRILLSFRVIK